LKRRDFIKNISFAAAFGLLKYKRHTYKKGDSNLKLTDKDVNPISKETYLKRISEASKLMKKKNINLLIITPSISFYYYLGFNTWRSERLSALLIPVKGEPAFLCPKFEESRFKKQLIIKDTLTWEEEENPYTKIKDFLSSLNLLKGKIALEETTRFFVYKNLTMEIPEVEVVNGFDIVNCMRMTKSEKELSLMQKAVDVTVESIYSVYDYFKEGITEKEVSLILSDEMSKRGYRGGGMVQFAQTSAIPHAPAGDRKLKYGNAVLIDAGTSVHGYRSDITRTAVFGKASKKMKKVYKTVYNAQSAAFELGKEGVTCENMDRAARKVIEKEGFGQYFTHRLGHGIGLNGHEYPYLIGGNKYKLIENITVTLEPGIYILDEFGIRIEDDAVIKKNRCVSLSKRQDKLIEI